MKHLRYEQGILFGFYLYTDVSVVVGSNPTHKCLIFSNRTVLIFYIPDAIISSLILILIDVKIVHIGGWVKPNNDINHVCLQLYKCVLDIVLYMFVHTF